MLQAFVSLKQQQPERTASELRNFFEALCNSMYLAPTHFCTDAELVPRAYDLEALVQAALNPACRRVFLRADGKRFWQGTLILPNKNGMGCMFFDFERRDGTGSVSVERLVETAKRMYKALLPLTLRVFDSEARMKLKSLHNLVAMPGIGRIEWLQIVSHDMYSPYYNMSELAVVPAHTAELWPDNTFFLRVYGDPKDWNNEENRSYANFAPANLAGIARNTDPKAEEEHIRRLEQMRNFAEKQEQSAYDYFEQAEIAAEFEVSPSTTIGTPSTVFGGQNVAAQPAAPPTAQATPASATQPALSPTTQATPAPAAQAASAGPAEPFMYDVIIARMASDYSGIRNSDFTYVDQVGPCTIFLAKLTDKEMYVTYQDLERKVFMLDELEDLSRFLQANDCSVNRDGSSRIIDLVKKYHRKGALYLDSLQQLPYECRGDSRLQEIAPSFNSMHVTDDNGANVLHIWYFLPDTQTLEELKISQFENWPITTESKKHATELEGDAEKAPKTINDKDEEHAPLPETTPQPAPVPSSPAIPAPQSKPAPNLPTPPEEERIKLTDDELPQPRKTLGFDENMPIINTKKSNTMRYVLVLLILVVLAAIVGYLVYSGIIPIPVKF